MLLTKFDRLVFDNIGIGNMLLCMLTWDEREGGIHYDSHIMHWSSNLYGNLGNSGIFAHAK